MLFEQVLDYFVAHKKYATSNEAWEEIDGTDFAFRVLPLETYHIRGYDKEEAQARKKRTAEDVKLDDGDSSSSFSSSSAQQTFLRGLSLATISRS